MEDSLKFIWKEDNLNKDFIIWQEILYFPVFSIGLSVKCVVIATSILSIRVPVTPGDNVSVLKSF